MAKPNENNQVPPLPPGGTAPGVTVKPVVTGPPPMEPYPEGVPDFRDPAQNPNENYYDPNEDVDQYGYQTGINGETNYDINVGMTGGLMDTVAQLEASKYGDRGYGVRGGDATTRGVAQEELSQYQLQQMLGSDSPLMRQRAAAGLAMAGSRGLMNSSLGIGASQGAMIAGAQPFALQDASWYGETAADNMDAVNRMEEANLDMRGRSMEAGARRDLTMLNEVATGYGDIRKAMIDIEDREDTQAWDTREREDTQVWDTTEREAKQAWETADRQDEQNWTTQERHGKELYEAEEAARLRAWKTAEGEAGRDWETGERIDTQVWKAEQDELNRRWTSNENMLTNTLAWAQTKLDAATKLGMTREQAFADMYASIMANPDKKFSKDERDDAVRKVKTELEQFYGTTGPGPYEMSFDPVTGTYDESLKPNPAHMPNANASIGEGGVTIVTNPDGTSTVTVPDGFDWGRLFNEL